MTRTHPTSAKNTHPSTCSTVQKEMSVMSCNTYRRESGFNLITMSIILTAASLIMVPMLPGQQAGDNNLKTISTIEKLDKVEYAMQAFLLVNGRRPCPADGQYDINTSNFGR